MARPVIKPKKLEKGAQIALVAPSSYCAPEDSALAAAQLEKLGFRIVVHPQCLLRDNMFAGTPEQKAAALNEMFANTDIDAIFCLRGGYGATHMLDKLDYDVIAANPKILMGYSDITALHGAIHHKTGLVTFHGPTANGFRDLADETLVAENDTMRAAISFLSGDVPSSLFRDYKSQLLQEGTATGPVFGGNLQLLSALIEAGPAYHPPFEGVILMVEDIGEEITKLDRQLGAWHLRGIFDQIAGLVVGGMTDIKDTPGRAGSFIYTVEDVLRRHLTGFKGPVVMDAPFGHRYPNNVFAQGVQGQLTVKNGTASLSLLESPFAA